MTTVGDRPRLAHDSYVNYRDAITPWKRAAPYRFFSSLRRPIETYSKPSRSMRSIV